MATASRPSAGRSRAARPSAGPVDAYVLHRYDWSESSLILDLFTRDQGRIAVAAKGAKRPYSQWRAVLLPFQRIHVGLARAKVAAEEVSGAGGGSSDIQNLRSADWAGGTAMPTGAALFSGFYLNELLLRLLARHDPHPRIFDAYAEALTAVPSADDVEVEAALRAFELVLLRDTGWLPDLSVATPTQRAIEAERRYDLTPEHGVVDAAAGVPGLTGATLVGLEAALQHGSFAALRQASRSELPALKRPLRALIQQQLGAVPLRTRRVMAGLQGF